MCGTIVFCFINGDRYPASTSYSLCFPIQMTIESSLQQHLPASLKKKCDEIKDIAFYYEEYIESLIESVEFSFEDYLEMKGRDDLFDLQGEVESTEIYVEYSINTVFVKYVDSTDEQTPKSAKVRVILS